MSQNYHLLFVHGWGFSKNFWRRLAALLPDYSIHYIDLGYLGGGTTVEDTLKVITEHQENIIAIGHSLGFIYLLKKFPMQFYHYIAINSFLCFSKSDSFMSGVPIRVLQRMSKGVEKDAFAVLLQFYKQCQYYSEQSILINNTQLKKGLEWLEQDDLRCRLSSITEKLTVIASDQDPVVSKEMTYDSFQNHPIEWIEDKTHILPITKSHLCAKIIRNVS